MIKKIMKKQFVKDNLVLFIGTFIANVFGFLFHFYMGRSLGPEYYGALGAALSIIYIMTIPLNTIQTSIAKFSSLYMARKEYGKIKCLFSKSMKILLIFGIILCFLFILGIPAISGFLHISSFTLILLTLFFIFALLVPINRGILQGMQNFNSLSVNLASEGVIKFAFGVLFVILGYGVDGAIGAIIASYIVVFFFGLIPLKKILKEKPTEINAKEVYGYSVPVLIMIFSLTLFYSIDILLVKHFFDNVQAGYYSAISLLGKIIFFGSISISQVMFPKISEMHQDGKASKSLLYKSLLLVAAFVIPAIAIYFFMPEFIVNILYGKDYMVVAPLLGWFAIFIGLTCFVYIISFYKAAINRRRFLLVLGVFNVAEILGVWFFHDSLMQVIQILAINMFLLFLILIINVIFSKNGSFVNNNPGL